MAEGEGHGEEAGTEQAGGDEEGARGADNAQEKKKRQD